MADAETQGKAKAKRANRSVAIACVCFTMGMVGMAYAAVPLYELFCQVTGYGGTTQRADTASDKVLDQEVTVRFDSNVNGVLRWDFDPEKTKMKVKIGETGLANYLVVSRAKVPTSGTASFNVSPPSAGAYFNKMECFCFTEQVLKPGEEMTMPVVFFIDPEYANDPDVKDVKEITLSYTFFPNEISKDALAKLEKSENNRVQ